jgi:putative tricarboxylic transport membrane protein
MTRDRVSALFFLAFSVAYGLQAQEIRLPVFAAEFFTAKTLPTALAVIGATISIMMLVLPQRGPSMRDTAAEWRGLAWWKIALLGVDMLVYGYILTRIGFIPATSLFLIVGFAILGERRWTVLLGASVPVVIVFWAILDQLLGIYLGAPLGRWGTTLMRAGESAATGGGG